MKHHFTRRFIIALVNWRWPLLLMGLLLASLAYLPSRQVRFDRAIENMFSPRDPIMEPFRQFKAIFGHHEVLLAVYEDPQLFDPSGAGIERVQLVSERLREVPGVRDVLSLAEINELVAGVERPFGLLAPRNRKPPILNDRSPLAVAYRQLFEGYTHSSDGTLVSLACMIDPSMLSEQVDDPQRQIVNDIRTALATLPDGLSPGMVAGEPVMVVDGFQLVEQDGRRLGVWSTILLSITLAVCFRNWRWLVVPLAVVHWAVLMTRALLSVLGLHLTLVSSMLTALVTVVGVATVTHLIVRFRENRADGLPARASFIEAATVLAWPVLGAIATDAVGFGSLWWSSVGPVFDFGTMMVLGSLLIVPAIIFLVPAMSLVGQPEAPSAPLPSDSRLRSSLRRIVATVAAWPRLVLAVSIVIGIFSAWGSLRLTVETDFTKNFRAGSALVRSYDLIESRLGGAGVWDVLLPAPEVVDQAYVDRVLALEERLRSIRLPEADDVGTTPRPALTKVISLADAIQASEADSRLRFLSPELRARGMAKVMPNFTAALRSSDDTGQQWFRIMLRSRERLPAHWKQAVLSEVRGAVQTAFPGTAAEPAGEVTGYHVLMVTLVDSLVRDQWAMFGLSCLGIAAMMLVAFRSFTLALLCLVPNVLPVLLVTGLLGWLEIRINMGAAMIAAVSMGLSVDSSIHYIAAFRRALAKGDSVAEALEEVQQSVGSAMVISTLAIVVGFGVLCVSDFIPTVYFGALASLTMLGGMAGNLVVLPLLLLWTTPRSAAGKPTATNGDAAPGVDSPGPPRSVE
jgi:predicted RND superfamily exporter protein